jgi:hypothetical protein
MSSFVSTARLAPACRLLSLLLLAAVGMTGCSSIESLLPSANPRPAALKIDPSEAYALAADEGARWVLFKLDIRSGMRRVVQTASNARQAVVAGGPEELLISLFAQARERARIEGLRSALNSLPAPAPYPAAGR